MIWTINVKKQFHPRRTDGVEDVHAIVDMIALIPGMSLVWVAVVPTVEHFQTNRHAFFLCVPSQLLETLDAVLGPFLGRELLRVTGERR